MATTSASSKNLQRVFGTVRDALQKPLSKVIVRVSSKGMRSIQTLGEATTDANGQYVIDYTPKDPKNPVIVSIWQDAKTLLKQLPPQANPPVSLQQDIDLGTQTYTGPSSFEQLVAAITPRTEGVALSDVTETSQQQDISFITQATGLPRQSVERIAMASRFEKMTSLTAQAWFALLDKNTADREDRIRDTALDFETRLSNTFDKLMHTPVDTLINTITAAADSNIIPFAITADLTKLRQQLSDQQLAYAKAHPQTGKPSLLVQKATLAGLQGADLENFILNVNNHSTEQAFFTSLAKTPALASNKNMPKAQAVFNLARLTDNNMDLTAKLVQSGTINSSDDLRQFAAHEAADWETILQNNKVTVPDPKATAAQLEAAFTREFPTASFSARLTKDTASTLPNKDKVSQFLQKNQQFDLVNTRIGQFIQQNKDAVPAADAPAVSDQLRRIQRMYRLAPNYKNATTLLNNNIHSAQQITKMGQENFVNQFSPQLGADTATQVFQQATQVHAAAVAVAGNLQSMASASTINAFPNFAKPLAEQLGVEIPNLTSLFGSMNTCECDECSSVYGAPAYLTDLLHFLQQRQSTLPSVADETGTQKPNAKDVFLLRRPDIGELDLECNNSNTEVPYIDIACEIMEDFISAPIALPTITDFSKLAPGPIDPGLLTILINAVNAAGMTNITPLMDSSGVFSEVYLPNVLLADNSMVTKHMLTLRFNQLTLHVALWQNGPGVEVRVIHQTLQSADVISSNPEYVNIPAYNLLKAAKRNFNLPFDFFQTEGETYLGQLGYKRADLIKLFAPNNTNMAYAALGVNQAEQNLIFQADPTNQALYWGSVSTATAIQADVFEDLTGLVFQQILDLLSLTFINPAKDSTVQSQTATDPASGRPVISADLTTKSIINLTPAKLDAIHRFLRLWRKTSFAMTELDAIIMSVGKGTVDATFAYKLQQFITLQQSTQLSTFQLLAFYGNIDTLYNGANSLYNQLFQNKALTNPVNPDLSITKVTAGTTNITAIHQSLIAGVLQVSVNDLNLLLPFNTKLTLPALSQAYRSTLLAQTLGVSITDLLKLVNVIDIAAFTDPASTNTFIQKYRLLQSSGFSIDELYYLFFHQNNAAGTLVPSADTVNTSLAQLQTDLLTDRNTAIPVADPNGVQLSAWLTDPVLNWDTTLKNKLVDLLNTVDDSEYQQKLVDNATFLLNLRIQYATPFATADLAALPMTATTPAVPITIPANLATQLSYNTSTRQLRLAGVLGTADWTALKALSTDAAWQAALTTLSTPATPTSSDAGNLFFAAAADVTSVLNGLINGQTASRFAFFLGRIAPVYAQVLQQTTLINDISSWFNINTAFVTELLQLVPAITTDLMADNFINKVAVLNNPAGLLYPAQATRYQSLAKLCFIANKLKMTTDALQFMLVNGITPISSQGGPVTTGMLDMLHLPLTPVTPAPATAHAPGSPVSLTGFTAFGNMYSMIQFERAFPPLVIATSPTTSFRWTVYAPVEDALGDLGNSTPDNMTGDIAIELSNMIPAWNSADANTVISALLVTNDDVQAMGYRLLTMAQAMSAVQQLGVPATTVTNWCATGYTSDISNSIKQAVRAKYSDIDWITVSTNLQNTLRTQKRDALVAYLLANPGTHTWKTTNDLFDYFLIDMEMCSCQPTSRIVQATNSLQLFVQRCFMQLEPLVPVITKTTATATADSGWLQWQWMKQFRLWQANVKVFLYPENYIEPELLPAGVKSSFLSDLQNDLVQNQLTPDIAQDAFTTYIQSLDGVARLQMIGMWHDQASSTLHVVGRTYGGKPKIYYYRQLINNTRWTPWERINLSIDSNHVVPVVYNSRIFLFWAVILEIVDPIQQGNQPIPVPSTATNTTEYTVPTPVKQWQIQLAFSEYKNGQWTQQKITPVEEALLTTENAGTPFSFIFAPLDIPTFDYANIFNLTTGQPVDTPVVFDQKAVTAVNSNGTLIIALNRLDVSANTGDTVTNLHGFTLDPVKGYPVVTPSLPYVVKYVKSGATDRISNMLSSQSGPEGGVVHGIHGANGVNFYAPDSARGLYDNLISWQMGVGDRLTYLTNIYAHGNKNDGTTNLVNLGTDIPYFYQDNLRAYFVDHILGDNGNNFLNYEQLGVYMSIITAQGGAAAQNYLHSILGPNPDAVVDLNRYTNFHHPQISFFLKQLFIGGTDALMDRDTTQLKGTPGYDPDPNPFSFAAYLSPNNTVYSGALTPVTYPNGVVDATPGYPKDNVEFSLRDGYGLYNWEVFFHAPLMVAEQLSLNQQFDEADRWYKYIFNPTDTSANSAPSKYWNTKPFFLTTSQDYINQSIQGVLNGINAGSTGSTNTPSSLLTEVSNWRSDPFQPHLIAETRTVAYQKVAVMKYIGHLIRYGDFLFSQDTMETVAQATQLYVLASEILGPKPETIPPATKANVRNYLDLSFNRNDGTGNGLDAMSDALVNIENLTPYQTVQGYNGTTPTGTLPNLQTLYFCIPMNENLVGPTGYWDVVADRLFKIRHCQDINGNAAPLALFAPAINPALLVQATAAGVDLGSILNDLNAPLPLYRFTFMVQKAIDLTQEVKSLGNLLLSVLEKKDAEALSVLRSAQEIKLTSAVLLLKQQQIQDAQSTIDNLNKQKELTSVRQKYYSGLIATGLSGKENASMGKNVKALGKQDQLPQLQGFAAAMHAIPTFNSGVSGLGSPVATLAFGGIALGAIAEVATSVIAAEIGSLDKTAAIASINAGYDRRAQDWQFQLDSANKEQEQLDVQIAGAQIRLSIAKQDVANQQLQIDQARETDAFLQSKYTNQDLYTYMITKVSNTYFKTYQLAYALAKQAEQNFRYELAIPTTSYINFGYWDSLHKGLLAGEQLAYDIKNMEMAYYQQNIRELELTKPISISQLDPVALHQLRTTGECWVNLPEELFDMDYPGHYMRRIKSLSITIPCISGPYTTVSCQVTMTRNSIRTSSVSTSDASQYPRKTSNGFPADDPRFRDSVGALQSIATSTAQNDNGLFEVNFRDERYLPFEGAGAISLWHIKLPAAVRSFDYNSISDVIINLKYTARAGGDTLAANAAANINARISNMLVSTKDKGLARIFSAKNDLSNEWYRFLNPVNPTDDQVLSLTLDNTRFPLFVQGRTIKVTAVEVIADSQGPVTLNVISPVGDSTTVNPGAGAYQPWINATADYSASQKDPGAWKITNPVANKRLTTNTVTDGSAITVNNIVIIVHYQVS